MLSKDPNKRPTIAELKNHKFFKGVFYNSKDASWKEQQAKVKGMNPVIIPSKECNIDREYFMMPVNFTYEEDFYEGLRSRRRSLPHSFRENQL